MIKVTDNFSISGDANQFIVTESYQAKDKNGADKTNTRNTYHPSLEQSLRYIRKQECKTCTTVEELLSALHYSYVLDLESSKQAL